MTPPSPRAPLRARLLGLMLLLATAAACGDVIQPATSPPTYGSGRSSGFQ